MGGALWKILPRLVIGGGDLFFGSYFCSKDSRRGGFFILEDREEGKFNVKSYYRSLKDENNPLFPAKEVWGSYAPFRTRFFAWEAV